MYVLLVENSDGFASVLFHGSQEDLYEKQTELEKSDSNNVYEIQFVPAVASIFRTTDAKIDK